MPSPDTARASSAEGYATPEALDDLDRRSHEHARDEADLAEAEPMPDAATPAAESTPATGVSPTRGVRRLAVHRGALGTGVSPESRRLPSPNSRTFHCPLTYVEALRDALATEMARDERVFLLGEDIGTYGGAFKVTDGLLDRFGAGARHRYPHL